MIGIVGYKGKMGGFHLSALKRLGHEALGADVVEGPVDMKWLAHSVDAAIIATPTEYHYEHASEFLMQGKSVLIEKPITLTIAEAQGLLDLSAVTGASISVGYLNRYQPVYQRAIKHIWHNTSGLATLRIFRSGPKPANDYGGVAIDLASHDIDLMLHAFTTKIRPIEVRDDRALYSAAGVGISCTIEAGYTDQDSSQVRKWSWYGSERIVLDMTEQTLEIDHKQIELPVVNQVEEQLKDWIGLLSGRKSDTLCTGEQALAALAAALGEHYEQHSENMGAARR